MRELKFRAWDKVNKRMGHFYPGFSWLDEYDIWQLTPIDGEEFISEVPCKENIEMMQYTGLKDKNGVEIYEGDVLCIDDGDEFYFPISYSEKYASFGSGALSLFELMNGIEVKISGNIYENPELLDK